MQSTPTPKDTDPHDVFAIETLLHAHAEKAPPLAHDPPHPPAPQVHIAPQISVSAPIPQIEPTFRDPDVRDIQVENVRPSEIKVDGLKPPGERPMGKWTKRVIMAAARPVRRHGCRRLAALWRSGQGDGRRVGAALRAGCIAFGNQTCRPRATERVRHRGRRNGSGCRATGDSSRTRLSPNPPPPPRLLFQRSRAQLQSMAQDLAAMNQQVQELKATIAQLRASQAQMAREFAKASEAKAAETRPAEQNQRPRVSALTPPAPRPAVPPPCASRSRPIRLLRPRRLPPLPQRRSRRRKPLHRCRLRRPANDRR